MTPKKQQKEKLIFKLLTEELHSQLIEQGFTILWNVGNTCFRDELFAHTKTKDKSAFVLLPNFYITFDKDGNDQTVPFDTIEIVKTIDLPKDIENEYRIEAIANNPFIGAVDGILSILGVQDDLLTRNISYSETAPNNIDITTVDVQYPIRSERVKEMYDTNSDYKFYVLFISKTK
jgi:hypothetical protein